MAREAGMDGVEREFGPVVPPWDDHDEERDVLQRMNDVVDEAQRAGATAAARLAVIAIGNHASQSPDVNWQQVIDQANSKLDEIEDATTRSRRWG